MDKSKEIIELYAALTVAARKITAPANNWLRRFLASDYALVTKPTDRKRISIRRWYFSKIQHLVSPLQFDHERNEGAFTVLALSAASVEVYALLGSLAILLAVSGVTIQQSSVAPVQSRPIDTWLIIIVTTMVHVFSVPGVYTRLVKALTSSPPLGKLAITVHLFIIVTAVCFAPMLDTAGQTFHYVPASPNDLLVKYANSLILIISLLLFVIVPAAGLISLVLSDALIWLVCSFAILGQQVVNYHQPISTRLVELLIAEPLLLGSEQSTSVALRELRMTTINALREWAQANRDGTDKRLMPTVLILAALQVVGLRSVASLPVWPALINLVQHVYYFFQTQVPIVSLGDVWYGVLIGLLAALLLLLIKSIRGLISNVADQGLIIEACIVAEYARKSTEEASSTPNSVRNPGAKSNDGRLKHILTALVELVTGCLLKRGGN